jgi:hypothetical protein
VKTTLLAPLGLLALSCAHPAPPQATPAAPEPTAAEPTPARAPLPAPAPPAPLAAIEGAPPQDLTLVVRPQREGRFAVRLQRKGHLVALRQGEARASGDGRAELDAATSSAPGTPIVWETSDPVTLVTTRGLVELESADAARLRLAEAPQVVASETRGLHACRAHEDGTGGATVICRVRALAAATNLTRGARDGVWAAAGAERTLLRLDLAVPPEGADAVAIGYGSGRTGVVVRAEASRVAGEERPVIVIQSAERAQPLVMTMSMKPPHRFRHEFDVDF